MTLLILYFGLAITFSFLCSLLEAVMLSVTYSQVALLVKSGKRSGIILNKYKEKIDRPLSAILTINTIANTVGAAGVGAQALAVFGSKYVAIYSAGLTFCILVFSEIIPKTLGAVYCKQLSGVAAYVIRVLIYITYPFVVAFEFLGRAIARKAPTAKVTREEVGVAADMGLFDGELKERERSIIKNLLHLNTIFVRDILTPRSVLFVLHKDMTVDETIKQYQSLPFSRIPIYGRDRDDITGLINRYQISRAYSKGKRDKKLWELARPIHIVPAAKTVASALDDFIHKREHIFLVVDEYGGTAGIITLEDAIETLLGVEIVDELDPVDDMQKYALEEWEKRKRTQNIQ